jgi:DNA polymerase I-like protein with 3'-5' exonuclease and polymerase domains
LNPVREGGHTLKVWGDKLGVAKSTPPEDFTVYTKETLEYCRQDVVLNKVLFEKLKEDSIGFSEDSILLEHEVSHILKQQELDGFVFDEKKAMLLMADLNCKIKETVDEVHATFKPKWIDDKLITPKLKKDGTLSKSGLSEEEYNDRLATNDTTPFMRKHLQEFNLGSRKQIGEYLIDFGWEPKKFTPTGQPIVDEGTLKKIIHIREAKLIADFLLYQKRLAQVKSWVEALKDDGKIHGSVFSTGAITGRMAHRNPNVAQVPGVYSPFGKECRECWTVPEGHKLVGIDASGLELRMLAHYMANEEYIHEIINGDIHTANQKAAGLESRDKAKTFIYALIYGAGDEKLGTIVQGNREDGKRLRESFLNNQPSFKALRDRVVRAAQKGYLKGLDGRKIWLRHKHAALNTLLQGSGAIAMKKALVIFDDMLKLQTIPAKIVGNIHDEWQVEVPEKQAEHVGALAVRCLEQVSKEYNLRCPLTGEYKIGENWSETH